jgi:hypothetical protein
MATTIRDDDDRLTTVREATPPEPGYAIPPRPPQTTYQRIEQRAVQILASGLHGPDGPTEEARDEAWMEAEREIRGDLDEEARP